jgi:TonB family protein
MFRRFCFLICLCILALSVQGQTPTTKKTSRNVPPAQTSDRESDGLLGPVRRVVVESASITVNNGEPAEGPRVVRGITTYDQRGNRVDTVAYPVEGTTPPGKEQYKYDDRGNIIEMQVRGADDSILSRETYKYRFDELGNWKQMTTSVSVFEDGKPGEEPVEVTYRAITYFYTQEVAKLTMESPTVDSASKQTNSNGATSSAPEAVITKPPAPVGVPASGEVAKIAPVSDKSTLSPPPVTTKRVSEEVLRRAAISLPQPEYPRAAELSRAKGRVSVELIVDEKGSVTHARGTSANPFLNEAAEAAARAARFSPTALSPDPARVTSVINYDFVLPTASAPPTDTPAESPVVEVKKTEIPTETTTNTAPAPASPEVNSSSPAISLFNQGVADLEAGNLANAVLTLKQSVDKDPEFAPAYVKLGIAYSGLRRYKEAVAVIKMAIQIKPDQVDAEAYFQLGNSYSGLSKHSEALNAFMQALYITRADAINPENQGSRRGPSAQELHYSIGLSYNSLGRYSDAIKELKQVIAINPQLAEAYYGLAVCYIGMGDRKSAEKQQKILTTLNPDLANRVAEALRPNRNLPPGVSEGMLGGSKRRN